MQYLCIVNVVSSNFIRNTQKKNGWAVEVALLFPGGFNYFIKIDQ